VGQPVSVFLQRLVEQIRLQKFKVKILHLRCNLVVVFPEKFERALSSSLADWAFGAAGKSVNEVE
jgi:hypothetical protein